MTECLAWYRFRAHRHCPLLLTYGVMEDLRRCLQLQMPWKLCNWGDTAWLPAPWLLQAGPSYAEAFLTVLRNVTKEDTVQYVLALLDDLLQGGCRSYHSNGGYAAYCTEDAFHPAQTQSKGSVQCAVDPSRAALFHKQSDVHKASAPDPYTIFLRCSTVVSTLHGTARSAYLLISCSRYLPYNYFNQSRISTYNSACQTSLKVQD